jgi:hypothetical protein
VEGSKANKVGRKGCKEERIVRNGGLSGRKACKLRKLVRWEGRLVRQKEF